MDFEEFLAGELDGLTRFAGVLTGDRQLAHDVLTDTLVVIGGQWRRISSMQYPAAYVRRAITNTFLSERRRSMRRKTDATDDPAVLDTRDVERESSVDDRDLLRRLLATVSPEQRAAVVMKHYLGMPDAEIAVVMGCAPGTVRSHLSRALRLLRLTALSAVKET